MTKIRSIGERYADCHVGQDIYNLAAKIFPICRSITGEGVRRTLDCLREHVELQVHEVPSGTQVLDWAIPREWTIRAAYIADMSGRRLVDFDRSNLHVMSYSVPVDTVMELAELKKHIFTLPSQPDLVPYRTSYYSERWGFCMSHRELAELPDGMYRVVIDSSLTDGCLTYGEYLHRGESEDEVLLSTHICHPSLANDNCSGLALLAHLARRLTWTRTRYSYRFLFVPGTIGAITWLARNEQRLPRIKHGLVVSCVGDGSGPVYKKSRQGDAEIDRVMRHVMRHAGPNARVIDFSPYGYDERQYCSPGFNLPVGLFQRGQFGVFPEYHTSGDNLDFIQPEHLGTSFRFITMALDVLENDCKLVNTVAKGEPQLGRRGLYDAIGGDKQGPAKSMAFLWLLNLSDGRHSLLDIAERADMPFDLISDAADILKEHGLLTDSTSIKECVGLRGAAPIRADGRRGARP